MRSTKTGRFNPLPPPSPLFEELAARDRELIRQARSARKKFKGFDPLRVGEVGYPRTQEAWEANRQRALARPLNTPPEKRTKRGWGGRNREELADHRENIVQEARNIVEHMKQTGLVSLEDERAEEALTVAVEIMRDKVDGGSAKDRLAAAKLVLEFTKQKPSTRTDVTVRRAEDFLSEIAGDE